MKHIIGFGHSLLHAISQAWQEFEHSHPSVVRYTPICLLDSPFAPAFTNENGIQTPNPVLVDVLRQSLTPGADVSVFLALSGSEYLYWSMSPGSDPFDFVDPEDDFIDPYMNNRRGQLIPYDLFMTFARDKLRTIERDISPIRQLTTLPLVQVVPPPPTRNLEQHVTAWRTVPEEVIKHGFSAVEFRVKVWRACARALSEVCEDLKIEVLPVPREAVDYDGCLRDEMVRDGFHANVHWGRSIVARLLKRAGLEG